MGLFGIAFLPSLDLFEIVLFLVEHLPTVLAFNLVLFTLVKPAVRKYLLCLFPLFVISAISIVSISSYTSAHLQGYDLSKPSLREALETYITTGEGDLEHIIESNTYPPVFGIHELNYLIKDLLTHTIFHLDFHNEMNIPVSYNKGNDWFRATLGEPMVYTSGIFQKESDSLMTAQHYKLDYVANAIDLQKGDKVLDIGCGWGTLVEYFSTKYHADVTGITLSTEQIKYFNETHGKKLAKQKSNSKLVLQDAMKLLKDGGELGVSKKYDKITALEMAEHVGIRRYAEFLSIVKELLKDDGTFYIQVAGLRRDWRWEDFVWGLFMGEHVFPGADASTPIGWVTTQLERAGFEVQRVSNLGNHYSRTLDLWLKEWRAAKKEMIAKYGEVAFRRWEVFLRWSVRIARQGSSTVFMITTTKQNQEPTRIKIQDHIVPVWKK